MTASKHKAPTRRRAAERFSGRSYSEYRRVFNEILSSAGDGRITLEALKDITRTLRQFFSCRIAEIVFKENHRVLHAKTVGGNPPATSGWKEKRVEAAVIFDAVESVPSDLVDRLKSLAHDRKPNNGEQKIVFMFPNDRRPKIKGVGQAFARHVFLLIPVDGSIAGVLVLSFARARPWDYISHDFLNRLAFIVGLSLNHNLSRFELRERVKELTCMYNIANLAARSDQPVDQFLQQVAELLPPAYLYPEITEARIVFDGKSYQTPGFVAG